MVILWSWIVPHDLFRGVRAFDQRILWLNALWLLSIVALPLTTEVLGNAASRRRVRGRDGVAVVLPGVGPWALRLLTPTGPIARRPRRLTSPVVARTVGQGERRWATICCSIPAGSRPRRRTGPPW